MLNDRVRIPSYIYAPESYTADSLAHPVRHEFGTVIELLAGGAVAVKFDGYPNVTDYTAQEAARFIKSAA